MLTECCRLFISKIIKGVVPTHFDQIIVVAIKLTYVINGIGVHTMQKGKRCLPTSTGSEAAITDSTGEKASNKQ